jgi:hypothetical protein
MPRFDGWIGGTYAAYSLFGANDRAINMIPEIVQSGTGENRLNFYNRPGHTLFCTLPTSPCRAMCAGDNKLYAVGGDHLYQVNFSPTDGSFVSIDDLGAHAASVNPAWIEVSPSQVAVYDGRFSGSIWVWNLDGSIALTEALTHARGLTYLDGYFVALRDATMAKGNQINISGVFDGLNWDPLDFQTRTSRADIIQAIIADHEMLWLFGKKTTEVWVNEPNGVNFPFQRYPEGLMEQGIWSQWSLAKLDESMIWLGGDDRGVGTVWRSNGFTPQRISNHAIENLIRKYAVLAGTDVSDGVAYTYVENGHSYYVITFTHKNKTIACDLTTGMWHERGEWDGSSFDPDTSVSQYKAALHAMTGNQHFVSGGFDGNIYVASVDTYDDDGQAILWQRSGPHLNQGNKMVRHKRFEVLQEQLDSSGTLPTATLEISNDGGRSYLSSLTDQIGQDPSDPSLHISRWQRLGRARDRMYRYSRTDANKQAWIDCLIETEPGDGG